jgi:hypothetical protein
MYDLMKFRNPSMKDIMKFKKLESGERLIPKKQSLTQFEVAADVGKWFTITSLLPPAGTLAVTDFERTALIGFFSGLVFQFIRENNVFAAAGELSIDISPSGSVINFRRPIVQIKKQSNVKNRSKEKTPIPTLEVLLQKQSSATNFRDRRRRKSVVDFVKAETEYLRKDLVKSFLYSTEEKEAEQEIDGTKKKTDRNAKIQSEDDIDDLLASRDMSAFRFIRSGVESASQILVYIASRDYVYSIAPYFNS